MLSFLSDSINPLKNRLPQLLSTNQIFIFYVCETRNGFRLLFTIRSPQLHAVGMGSLCLMTENAKLKITFKILSN